MSVKAKIAAGAATLTLVGGGLGMVGTLTASAATPSCGSCSNIFTQKFGPQYLLDVYQGQATAGQSIILFQASNSDKAEDFVVVGEGSVHDFYHHYGLVSAAFAKAYSDDTAYEIQYEPYGLNSNMCVSTWPGEVPQAGYKARLESCGTYSNSLWAADTTNEVADARSTSAVFTGTGEDTPLINGADDSFSNPLVLNYSVGNPTDMPRPSVNVQPEATYDTTPATVYDSQEWGTVGGGAS
jgi:hypothetical protein